jgi:hypothetical protein
MGMDRKTLIDIARETDPDGTIAEVAEILHEMNPFIQDAPAMASNNVMTQLNTIRDSLPTVARGQINKGIVRSKSTSRQEEDDIGMYVGRSEVDARTPRIVGAGNFAKERANEDDTFIESINQTVIYDFLYGDVAINSAGCTGLQPRLETAATAITGSQVAKHHASPAGSDYTSVYIVDWDERACHLIYPKASQAGLYVDDLGKNQVLDADGAQLTAFVTEYMWLVGLTVKDPRHIGRLANIDVSQALADTTTLLYNSLIPMLNRMPTPRGQRVLYTSRNIKTAFELQLKSVNNVFLSMQEYQGKPMLHVHGYPVRSTDGISEAESVIT